MPLEEIFRESDVISLNCPLTDQTAGMINKKTIAEMKLVKEEADTLAITFGAEAKEMWTVQLEDAVKLQNAISSALVESE